MVLLAGGRGVTAGLARAARLHGVRDSRVLGAVCGVERADFVPEGLAGEVERDAPIPIGMGQTTSQPSLVARMVEALGVADTEMVLEVGAGLGYQTAILSHLARHVWAVELLEPLAAAARQNLERAGITNATVIAADGRGGLPERAPFDRIVISATADEVPAPLVEQLRPGGTLVAPIRASGFDEVVLFRRSEGGLQRVSTLCPAVFVPLVAGPPKP